MTVFIGVMASNMSPAHAGDSNQHHLQLLNDRTEELLLTLPVVESEQVTYRYIHSVEGTPVEEMLEISEGRLWAVGSRSERFGLGHMPRAGTLEDTADGDTMQATGYRHPLPELVMFTGTAESPNMELIWRDKKYGLSQEFPSLHLRWRIQRATQGMYNSQYVSDERSEDPSHLPTRKR